MLIYGYWIKIGLRKSNEIIIINKENKFIPFVIIKYILNIEMTYRDFINL